MIDPILARCCDTDGELRCTEVVEGCQSSPIEPESTNTQTATSAVHPPERVDQSSSSSSKPISTKHTASATKTHGAHTLLGPTPFDDPPISASFSTETLANTTVTWLDGVPLHQATTLAERTSKITTTTYDPQSQTVVTTTEPAVLPNAPPYCNANGQCTLLGECFVTLGGFITCSGSGYTRPTNDIIGSNTGSSSSSFAVSTSFGQRHGSTQPRSTATLSLSSESNTDPYSATASTPTTRTRTTVHQTTSDGFSSFLTVSLTSSIESDNGVEVVYATEVVTVIVTAQPVVEVYVPAKTDSLILDTSTPIPSISADSSSKSKISEDGACGESVEQTCKGSSFGDCCSIHGTIN